MNFNGLPKSRSPHNTLNSPRTSAHDYTGITQAESRNVLFGNTASMSHAENDSELRFNDRVRHGGAYHSELHFSGTDCPDLLGGAIVGRSAVIAAGISKRSQMHLNIKRTSPPILPPDGKNRR